MNVVELIGACQDRTGDRRIKRQFYDNDLAHCSVRASGPPRCCERDHVLSNSGPFLPVCRFRFATAMVRPARPLPPAHARGLEQWCMHLARVPLAARTAHTHRDSCRVAPGGQGINDVASAGVCIPEADPRQTCPDTRSAGRVESRHSESRPSGRAVFRRPGPASSAGSTSERRS
jgi:hypothetical protein